MLFNDTHNIVPSHCISLWYCFCIGCRTIYTCLNHKPDRAVLFSHVRQETKKTSSRVTIKTKAKVRQGGTCRLYLQRKHNIYHNQDHQIFVVGNHPGIRLYCLDHMWLVSAARSCFRVPASACTREWHRGDRESYPEDRFVHLQQASRRAKVRLGRVVDEAL